MRNCVTVWLCTSLPFVINSSRGNVRIIDMRQSAYFVDYDSSILLVKQAAPIVSAVTFVSYSDDAFVRSSSSCKIRK